MPLSLKVKDIVALGEDISVRVGIKMAEKGDWEDVMELVNEGVSLTRVIGNKSIGKLLLSNAPKSIVDQARSKIDVWSQKALGRGSNPLGVAVSSGNMELLKEIVENNKDVKIKPTLMKYDGSKMFPMEIAAFRGDLEQMDYLARHGLGKASLPLVLRGICGQVSLEKMKGIVDWTYESGNFQTEICGRWDLTNSNYLKWEDLHNDDFGRIDRCNMLSFALAKSRQDVFSLLIDKVEDKTALFNLDGFDEDISATCFGVALRMDDVKMLEMLSTISGGVKVVGCGFVNQDSSYMDSYISSPVHEWGFSWEKEKETSPCVGKMRRFATLRRENENLYFLSSVLTSAVRNEAWKCAAWLCRNGAELDFVNISSRGLSDQKRSMIEAELIKSNSDIGEILSSSVGGKRPSL